MGKVSVSVSRRRGVLECNVHSIPDWDGFEKIARFLEKYYHATVSTRIDGPDARRWILQVGEQIIELQHEDPWGNTIVAPSSSAEDIVSLIADDLARRLKGIHPLDT